MDRAEHRIDARRRGGMGRRCASEYGVLKQAHEVALDELGEARGQFDVVADHVHKRVDLDGDFQFAQGCGGCHPGGTLRRHSAHRGLCLAFAGSRGG
jgi:hypothetical protein